MIPRSVTFAQLLEHGYTIEQAVAYLEQYNTPIPQPKQSWRDQDLEDAKRDREDWWKK